MIRLCNPTKSSLCLHLSPEADVDLWDFDANYNSEDRAVLMRLESLCRPDTLLQGCETKWAEQQREIYRAKYESLRKRLFEVGSAPPSLLEEPGSNSTSAQTVASEPLESNFTSLLPTVKLGSVPPLPPLILGREDALLELKQRLLVRKKDASTSTLPEITQTLTVMRGWPGVGKTTLSKALAHDADIHAAFPDGILWTSLGTEPNLLFLLTAWGNQLQSDALRHCADVKDASEALNHHFVEQANAPHCG